MRCSECENKPPDKEILYQCDSCKAPYCVTCIGVSPTEIRVLQLKNNRVLKLFCNRCKNLPQEQFLERKLKSIETTILDEIRNLREDLHTQDKIIMNQSDLINRLVNEVNKLKEKNDNGINTIKERRNQEILVIKPKEKQQSVTTKNDLKEKVDPKQMAIGVENIREGKEGAVIISCNTTNAKEKIKKTVQIELGNKYNITEGKKKEPRVIIRGVENDFIDGDNDMIIKALKEQNELNTGESTVFGVHAKFKQKGKRNNGNIILTVDATLKNQICEAGKLNIGWRRCVVHEYFTVIRCFNCGRYGHMKNNCKNEVTCYKCAGTHKTGECSCDFEKCVNCMETNAKYKKSLDVQHMVTDIKCPCYQRIIKIEENKTRRI